MRYIEQSQDEGTRLFDDPLVAALARGIDQVAILGAGFDTRAYRIPGIEKAKVFEIDQPRVQDSKRTAVAACLGGLPPKVEYLPVDFEKQDPYAALLEGGLDFTKPAFFIWEAVTQYLSAQAVGTTLAAISNADRGSELVCTYIIDGAVSGRSYGSDSMDLGLALEKKDSSWIFGLDPATVGGFIGDHGFELIEDRGGEFLRESYLRQLGRELRVSGLERVLRAKPALP